MRFAVGISYIGTNYHGWQRQQQGVVSVQEIVEKVLSQIANHKIVVYCAGRTDKGVHANLQVVHFDTNAHRNENVWLNGANCLLLQYGMQFTWIKRVSVHFHARYSALARRYVYFIDNNKFSNIFLRQRVTWFKYPLKIKLMQIAASSLLGEQNFSSFRSSICQAKSPYRCIYHINVYKNKQNIIGIDIQANAFLHHMIRNIVGVLLDIGSGRKPFWWAKAVQLSLNRSMAGKTAAADGLYLYDVIYPKAFSLPNNHTLLPLVFLDQQLHVKFS